MVFLSSAFAHIISKPTMDTPFIYDRFVTGKNFIGRKSECAALCNLLSNRENVRIYEPPMTGKKSVIQQALFDMRLAGRQYAVFGTNLFNIRSVSHFLLKFGSSVIRAAASTPAEYAETVGTMLAGTHFIFDHERFSMSDEVLTLDGTPDENDIRQLLALPGRLAEGKKTEIYVIIDEFQELLKLDEKEYEDIFRILSEILSDNKTGEYGVSFILSGSKVNAMKFIFEERKYFFRKTEHLPLHKIGDREIADHILRGFSTGGKVIEQDLVMGAIRLFDNNIWYLSHFSAICDSLSKGFLNEGILMDALNIMISIHRHRFTTVTDDLTVHQLSLLRAILDGENKFSSTEVIEKYGLNSSANVRRVKDALKKKEIITFNDKEEAWILDPLFRYWIEKYYFER